VTGIIGGPQSPEGFAMATRYYYITDPAVNPVEHNLTELIGSTSHYERFGRARMLVLSGTVIDLADFEKQAHVRRLDKEEARSIWQSLQRSPRMLFNGQVAVEEIRRALVALEKRLARIESELHVEVPDEEKETFYAARDAIDREKPGGAFNREPRPPAPITLSAEEVQS